MKTYLYLSDIHSNFEALKHLDSLPTVPKSQPKTSI